MSFACIGLSQPKFSQNVGGVLRIAYNYNVKMVALTGKRYKRQATDTHKSYKHIPILQVNNLHNVIPYDCIPVAVDLLNDAISLTKFHHPKRAFYIFGAEDNTLGKSITDWCKYKVYIPTNKCMNLAVTVGIVLYDRISKYEI